MCGIFVTAPKIGNQAEAKFWMTRAKLGSRGRRMRDSDVRKAMRAKLAALHADEADTRIVEEMGIWAGSVRVDIAVINGELCGFELKSARDNLNRLPAQRDLYGQVFDRVTLVTAEKHLEPALKAIPDWWGIIMVGDGGDETASLEHRRPAGLNPSVNPLQVARLLWRGEAIGILERYGASTGLKSKTADALAQRVADLLSPSVLSAEVRQALKERANWLR